MSTKIDPLHGLATIAEIELRIARRWRDNRSLANLFTAPSVRAEWLATCRQRVRESALLWRSFRRQRRALLGLPDVGRAV